MFKKLSLFVLILINFRSTQADFSGSNFWGAFLGAFLGSNQISSNKATATSNQKLCISGCNSKCEVQLACGHCMCQSCNNSARDTALRYGKNLVCRQCGKTAEQYKSAEQLPNNRDNLCASGCNSKSEVALQCHGKHQMCLSCLRSRITKANKTAGAGEPYVTCPKCGDMLTENVIRKSGQ